MFVPNSFLTHLLTKYFSFLALEFELIKTATTFLLRYQTKTQILLGSFNSNKSNSTFSVYLFWDRKFQPYKCCNVCRYTVGQRIGTMGWRNVSGQVRKQERWGCGMFVAIGPKIGTMWLRNADPLAVSGSKQNLVSAYSGYD